MEGWPGIEKLFSVQDVGVLYKALFVIVCDYCVCDLLADFEPKPSPYQPGEMPYRPHDKATVQHHSGAGHDMTGMRYAETISPCVICHPMMNRLDLYAHLYLRRAFALFLLSVSQ